MICLVDSWIFEKSICLGHDIDDLEPIYVVPPEDAVELGTKDANLLEVPTSPSHENSIRDPHPA